MNTTKLPEKPCDSLTYYAKQITQSTFEKVLTAYPDMEKKYGPEGLARAEEDIQFHLQYLRTAVCLEDKNLFLDYVGWLKSYFNSIKLPDVWTIKTMELLKEAIKSFIPADLLPVVLAPIDHAIKEYPDLSIELRSFISPSNKLNVLANQYVNSLLRKDRIRAEQLVTEAITGGVDVRDIYLNVFQPAQWEVGRLWQSNEISVAMEHYFTAATQFIMSRLYTYIFSGEKNGKNLVATSVSGELHELGIRMVSDFFELEGWSTTYLGANTPHPSIVQMIKETEAQVLAISATIPYNIPKVEELIKFVRKEFTPEELKIIVGGKPFNSYSELWKKVNADGYALDAQSAIEEASRLIS